MAVYEIADVRFSLVPTDPFLKAYIEDYRVEAEQTDEQIVITAQDLSFEKKMQPAATAGILHTSALCRKFSKLLLDRYSGILIHAAAIIYQGKAYLFVAPSGTGKTTHIMLWKKCLGEKMQILNGDKPFLREQDGKITVYGSPWQGKEGYGMNSSCVLGGVYLLHRGAENTLRPALAQDVLLKLLPATLFPEDADSRDKVLGFLDKLYHDVPVSVLHCNMEDEAVYTVLTHIEKQGKIEES